MSLYGGSGKYERRPRPFISVAKVNSARTDGDGAHPSQSASKKIPSLVIPCFDVAFGRARSADPQRRTDQKHRGGQHARVGDHVASKQTVLPL